MLPGFINMTKLLKPVKIQHFLCRSVKFYKYTLQLLFKFHNREHTFAEK